MQILSCLEVKRHCELRLLHHVGCSVTWRGGGEEVSSFHPMGDEWRSNGRDKLMRDERARFPGWVGTSHTNRIARDWTGPAVRCCCFLRTLRRQSPFKSTTSDKFRSVCQFLRLTILFLTYSTHIPDTVSKLRFAQALNHADTGSALSV
jgi:hypothetical protein